MKKMILALAATLAFAAGPALAGSNTVEFVRTDGTKTVIQFNTDGSTVVNGTPMGTYKAYEADKKICGTIDGKEVCATFEAWGKDVGHTTKYTSSDGSSGTATLTAVVP